MVVGARVRGPAVAALLCATGLSMSGAVSAQSPSPRDDAEPASAADDATRAKSRAEFSAGVEALEAGRARDALSHFEEAERLYPHYATAYNIGLCHRALGHPVEAAAAFQRYLAGADKKIGAEQFEAVAALIQEAEAKIAKLTLRALPAGAAVTIDGAAAQSGKALRVNPGEHRVDARAPGHEAAARTVRIASGESATVELVLPRADAPATPSTGPRLDGAFWALAGVSAVFLTTGVITGAIALSDSSAWEDPQTPQDEADDRRARGEVLRVVADVSFGLAIAGGVGAALLAVLRDPPPAARAPSSAPAPAGVRAAATIGSSSAAVVVVGAF